jgi:hypothetical protein
MATKITRNLLVEEVIVMFGVKAIVFTIAN